MWEIEKAFFTLSFPSHHFLSLRCLPRNIIRFRPHIWVPLFSAYCIYIFFNYYSQYLFCLPLSLCCLVRALPCFSPLFTYYLLWNRRVFHQWSHICHNTQKNISINDGKKNAKHFFRSVLLIFTVPALFLATWMYVNICVLCTFWPSSFHFRYILSSYSYLLFYFKHIFHLMKTSRANNGYELNGYEQHIGVSESEQFETLTWILPTKMDFALACHIPCDKNKIQRKQ